MRLKLDYRLFHIYDLAYTQRSTNFHPDLVHKAVPCLNYDRYDVSIVILYLLVGVCFF